ncbi:MAG: PAS domain S-box protein [Deltaproteobacteria bacterium]|nr:PAS domain S-box protein [Deltaproteobacteria bacterium]
MAFYQVQEPSGDLVLKYFEPEKETEAHKKEWEAFIPNGTLASALREKKALLLSSPDFKKRIVLQAMATQTRVRGLFFGTLPYAEKNIPEVALRLLHLNLLTSAIALENLELYEMSQKSRGGLENQVQERTQELSQALVKLQSEVTEHQKTEEALRATERRYRLISENMVDTVMLLDMDLNLIFASPSVERVLGYGENELKNLPIEKWLTPFSLSFVLKSLLQDMTRSLNRAAEVSPLRQLELEFLRRDGSTYWSEVQFSVLQDPQKGPLRLLAVGRDITERRRMQEELRRSEATARRLAAETEIIAEIGRLVSSTLNSEEVYDRFAEEVRKLIPWERLSLHLIQDPGNTVVVAHRVGLKMEGRERGDHFPYPDSLEAQMAESRQGITLTTPPALSPLSSQMAVPLVAMDRVIGALHFFSSSPEAYPERNLKLAERVAHQIASAIANARLFQERQQAEEALRENEALLRTLFNSVEDLICIKDRNFRYVLINDFFQKRFQISSSVFLGKTDAEVTVFKGPEKVFASTKKGEEKVLAGETLEYDMVLMIHGKEMIFQVIKTPLKNSKGEITGICAIARDISERKKLEGEIRRARKLEVTTTLAGRIADDFTNLLTSILGTISLAKSYFNPEDKGFVILEEGEKNCLWASDLTKQLITLAQAGLSLKKVVPLGKMIVQATEFALSRSNVHSDLKIPEDLWLVEVDETEIRQVIHEIVMNAREAMPEGGSVFIQAENVAITGRESLRLKEGKYVKISIEDHGVGIPPENLLKIFDPYFSTKTKAGPKGMGFSLSICYSIIKSHKGIIQVESEVGVGTTFYIYLPATSKGLPSARPGRPAPFIDRGRVLIMEDIYTIRQITAEMLRHIGYEVETAGEGSEVIELYKQAKEAHQDFDVVILNLTIQGGMGARETIGKLLEIDPSVKAIVSSAYSKDPVMAEFAQHGFKEAIIKPYRLENLREIVSQVIGMGPAKEPFDLASKL